MQALYRILYGMNLIGGVAYLLICGLALAQGHAYYPGQPMLLGQVALGLILASLPAIIGRLGHFRFPLVILLLWEAFILCAVLLGTGMQFYSVPYWDKFLHLFSASMLAGLGLAIFGALTPQKQLVQTSPLLLALFAVAFGTMLGVFWEFYEFTGDGLLGLNMQRYMVGHTLLRGRAVLMDTMGDLCADFLGALALGIWCYLGVRRDRQWLETFQFQAR
ncbi:MAG: hypothetical protein LKJ69_10015 [Lactobacillus sp.]|nr:hypothetical protein [Lactobacillus sp.]